MKAEVQLPAGIAIVNLVAKGASIEIDRFKATLTQLQVLEMLSRGLKRDQIARNLGVATGRVHGAVAQLLDRNKGDFYERNPSVEDLIDVARHHEILGQIPIIGIEVFATGLRYKSSASKDIEVRVQPSETQGRPPASINTKNTDAMKLTSVVSNSPRLLAFAGTRLDEFAQNQKEYTEDELTEIRRCVLLLLQGQEVSKSAIVQSGLRPSKISTKAVQILMEFRQKQTELRNEAKDMLNRF